MNPQRYSAGGGETTSRRGPHLHVACGVDGVEPAGLELHGAALPAVLPLGPLPIERHLPVHLLLGGRLPESAAPTARLGVPAAAVGEGAEAGGAAEGGGGAGGEKAAREVEERRGGRR
jgi:hypothetical protein